MKRLIFRSFADLRFAIVILLMIASFSIIGTVIEQDQSTEVYKMNYPLSNPVFGFLSWDIILRFGLDHVYQTWWFLLLIFLFGLSLLTCTILQQFPSLSLSRRCQFFRTIKQFRRLKLSTKLNQLTTQQLLFRVKNSKYSIFQQKNIIYCYKGLIGRIAPIVVHFSMIIILLGAITGALEGFKAQEIIPKTETFHIQNILSNGKVSSIPRVSGRINDFWITYTKQNTISQFYSDLSLLNIEGTEIKRQTIFVNSPARYNGINYYQTDWNLISVRIQNSKLDIFQYPLVNFLSSRDKIWITWIPNNPTLDQGNILLVDNLQGFCAVYENSGKFIGNLELNEPFDNNLSFTLVDIMSSTGLQIKKDPGIPLIYMGFFLLMVSTLISYITYSQLWIIRDKNQLFIGGNTTRDNFQFELEFFELVKD